MSRKEKRKNAKKLKRKQDRQHAAEVDRQKEEAVVLDTQELLRRQQLETEELAKERREHEEQERLWLLREEQARQDALRKQEEAAARKQEEWKLKETEKEDEDGWEYVEDGPAEIIWQGNEIIVKKAKRKVLKSNLLEDANRATSNPLPPQSTAFHSHKTSSATSTVHEEVAQCANYGTEQDKKHCPFYIKTGVCRFGVRCSRVHPVFNDKAVTLLIRSMYTGPGLAWDHQDGLEIQYGFVLPSYIRLTAYCTGRWAAPTTEDMQRKQHPGYTDEEIAQHYEEFYDDVHSEFLQFGELVNFKVCRNGSPHLRGNVYVHYCTEESAMAAYNALNGRFYAGKQITCEFVGVTKWRVAICGEYLKTNYRPCSHGTACNFLHSFRNPRGEYEWADWDAPSPRSWQAKMAKLFGYSQDSVENRHTRRRKDHDYDDEGKYDEYHHHTQRHQSSYHDSRRQCYSQSRHHDRWSGTRSHRRSSSEDLEDRSPHGYDDEEVTSSQEAMVDIERGYSSRKRRYSDDSDSSPGVSHLQLERDSSRRKSRREKSSSRQTDGKRKHRHEKSESRKTGRQARDARDVGQVKSNQSKQAADRDGRENYRRKKHTRYSQELSPSARTNGHEDSLGANDLDDRWQGGNE